MCVHINNLFKNDKKSWKMVTTIPAYSYLTLQLVITVTYSHLQ